MTDLRHYDVITSPVITEKTTLVSEQNQIVFNVAKSATKSGNQGRCRSAVRRQGQIRQHARSQGQGEAFRGTVGRQSDVKKAVVTLVDGESVDVTTGL